MNIKSTYNKLPRKTKRVIKTMARSEIVLLAMLVGALSAFLSLGFRFSIEYLFELTHLTVNKFNNYWFILPVITALGGLISGYIIYKYSPEAKGSGIPLVKNSLFSVKKPIRIRSLFVKFLSGVTGIGTGMSLGREGPSVHLGAGAGCLIAKLLKLQPAKRNKLVAAGAGSAIAATFNAPITATIFVLEELVHVFSSPFLFPILIATVTASTIARHYLGNHPAFILPEILTPITLNNIGIFIILGLIAGFLGVFFNKTIVYFIVKFNQIKIKPYFKVAFAGFITGLIGLYIPAVLGTGNTAISELFLSKFSLSILGLIFIFKFLLTSICFGSGASGGLFLPTLMLGSFTGYFIGYVSNTIFSISIDPIVVGLVGMGAFLAAVARTPLTAVVIVFELTADYNHILPMILSAAIADIIADKMQSPSIYTVLMNKRYLKIKPQSKKEPQEDILQNIPSV